MVVSNDAAECDKRHSCDEHVDNDSATIIDAREQALAGQYAAVLVVSLTDNITIFAAELCAIKLALQWVTSNSDKNVCIFSDSYSSLQAIASGRSICRPNLLLYRL